MIKTVQHVIDVIHQHNLVVIKLNLLVATKILFDLIYIKLNAAVILHLLIISLIINKNNKLSLSQK